MSQAGSSYHLQCYLIFTVRKRSLRRLCFYTCLSVILFTEGGLFWDTHTPPRTDPPPWSRPPPSTPPGSRQPPLEQTSPGADTPEQTPPPRADPLEQTPPRAYTRPLRASSRQYASYWNAYLSSITSS